MASQTVQTVIELKKSLAKELAKDNSNENDSDKCLDLLKRLDEVSVNIKILTETLVGAVVSKFKSNSHQEVASTAKALVKKWKRQAKQENNAASSSSSSSPKPSTSKSTPSKKKPSAARSTRAAPAAAAAPPPVDSAEWSHLPPPPQKNGGQVPRDIQRIGGEPFADRPLLRSSQPPLHIPCHRGGGGDQPPFERERVDLLDEGPGTYLQYEEERRFEGEAYTRFYDREVVG